MIKLEIVQDVLVVIFFRNLFGWDRGFGEEKLGAWKGKRVLKGKQGDNLDFASKNNG